MYYVFPPIFKTFFYFIFFQVCHLLEGCCFSQPAVLKAYTGTSQCGSQPGWLVGFHRFRPSVDGPSWTQWGSMPVLVRDLAP